MTPTPPPNGNGDHGAAKTPGGHVAPSPVNVSALAEKIPGGVRLVLFTPVGPIVTFWGSEYAKALAHDLLEAATGIVLPDT